MNTAGRLAATLVCVVAASAVACPAGCKSNYRDSTARHDTKPTLRQEVGWTVNRYKERDPSIEKFFRNSHGYAVFPKVTKGAIGIGGAHGDGEVYEKSKFIGRAELSQGSVGLALGGAVYSEIIFFRDEVALANFKGGRLEFSAQASAVAVHAGGAAAVDYENGVAVFVMPEAGLMFEASIGGQSFKFHPLPK